MARKLTSNTADKLEILKQYYHLDEENNLFHITLHYKSVDDLFYEKVSSLDNGKRKMKEIIIHDICTILADIPSGYKVNFSINIDDYKDMKQEEVLDDFNDILYLWHSRYMHTTRMRMVKAAFLILFGIALILLMAIGEIRNWWPESGEVADRLLIYLLDATGGVLIWEGIFFAFIERTPGLVEGSNLTTKLASIGLHGTNSNRDLNSSLVSSVLVTKTNRVITSCMILAGAGFFGSFISALLVTIPDIFIFVRHSGEPLHTLILGIIFFGVFPNIVDLIMGVLTFRIFFEDYSRWKMTLVMNPILIVSLAARIVSAVIFYDWFENVISLVLEALVIVVYFIGFGIIFARRKTIKDISGNK